MRAVGAMNLDIITPAISLAALSCRVAKAEAEAESYKIRFEDAVALLKLVKDTRNSYIATPNREAFRAWEGWVDGRIKHAEDILTDLRGLVEREGGRGNRTMVEKLIWVIRDKDVAENLRLRLDPCYSSLLAILVILLSARGKQERTCLPESGQSTALVGIWPEDNGIPCICFSNFEAVCSANHHRLLPSDSPCLSRSTTDLSSIDGVTKFQGTDEYLEEDDIEMYEWLREKARADSMEVEDEEEEDVDG
ncbi:hypothetical protein FGG08_003965 [Glutinoglossum americanum]|uniref:Uncharacterized protein n=1 Tax=Glutinoglossum americanum TaxID=1670608 RepID=A0A9P8L2Y7_9PEZI|nr:hypothetical protein FGG08_003965 [Glutinoglossum americanum]